MKIIAAKLDFNYDFFDFNEIKHKSSMPFFLTFCLVELRKFIKFRANEVIQKNLRKSL